MLLPVFLPGCFQAMRYPLKMFINASNAGMKVKRFLKIIPYTIDEEKSAYLSLLIFVVHEDYLSN